MAELSLGQLAERLQEAAGEEGRALLVDADGAPVTAAPELTADEAALVREGLRAQTPLVRSVRDGASREWLASFAPVPDLGWGVLVTRSAAVAYGPAESVRRYTLFGTLLALLAAGVLGLVLAREVNRPLARLAGVVGAFGEGRYDTPVPVTSSDEVGALGRALAHMASEVQRRDGEIRLWGEQLEPLAGRRGLRSGPGGSSPGGSRLGGSVHWRCAPSAAWGSRTVKVEPTPSALSTRMRPWWAATI